MSDQQGATGAEAMLDERALEALSDRVVAKLQDHLADVASGAVVGTLWDEVRALREDVEGLVGLTEELALLRSELVEGLVVEPSDSLSASLDALRVQIDELRDVLAERAGAPADPAPAEVAELDPAVVEVLREEIRAAGGVSDGVVDALREELKALRRRLAVKASERVLDDAQLDQIADAVAERLGRS